MLPISHQLKQNRANSGAAKIKVSSTQVRDVMGHPVLCCKFTESLFSGVSAIAVYTVAFVWTMEMTFGKWGKWKSILGFAFAFGWPTAR